MNKTHNILFFLKESSTPSVFLMQWVSVPGNSALINKKNCGSSQDCESQSSPAKF